MKGKWSAAALLVSALLPGVAQAQGFDVEQATRAYLALQADGGGHGLVQQAVQGVEPEALQHAPQIVLVRSDVTA